MLEKRQKILIVDDTPANIQILHEVLHGDYDIFFATSGPDAIRIATKSDGSVSGRCVGEIAVSVHR